MGFFGGGGGAAGVGGSTGATDNAILRSDGTGGATLQNSDLNVDDASTTTQNNVAITNQHSGQTNSALVLTPKGTGAFIVGPKPDGTAVGGNARGTDSICMVTGRNSATQIAAQQGSVAIGYRATASGATQSIAIGENNVASGNRAYAIGGTFNTASARGGILGGTESSNSGNFGAVISGYQSTVVSDYGYAFGNSSSANRYNLITHSGGRFSAIGDNQMFFATLRCKTTTNSAVEMSLDGGTTYLTIPSGKVIFCNIKVVGTKSDGSAVATYQRQYAAKNVAGTSSEVYAPVTIGTDNAASTSLAVTTVDAGDYISIKPTGIASETWRWVASVDAVEVAYGT